MRAHRVDDYMTKMTAVAPDAHCKTPLWTKFLERVTDGKKDLQSYLARVHGYSLTGVTTEHQMWFYHGSGRNGKSVFMNTVANIFGDYHRNAPIETFTATRNEQHPTELAMLRGARMVSATETEEGKRWAESRLKTITGGDIISARFMRQDFFEFRPQFKLHILGNHKPGLRSVDEAIRARINLVPFTVFIPEDERDPHLTDKLKKEWPGILAWLVKGCIAWQRQGLAPPKVVTEATKTYLDNEDTIAAWVDDCCKVDKKEWTGIKTLFASWKSWAESHGEYVIPMNRFCERLDALGHPSTKVNGARGRQGLGLTPYQAYAANVGKEP
jgi:putative DNA primase/helicase